MKIITALLILFLILDTACMKKEVKTGNPLIDRFDTPFGVPPFDKIQMVYFKPALEEGMKRQNDEIKKICTNTDEPDFDNTIAALDYSGDLLNTVSSILYNINSANTNDSVQAILSDMAPVLSEHSDDIMLNAKLFEKIKKVYDQREKLSLNTEQQKLLDNTYKDFVRSGAGLDTAKQTLLRKINSDLSKLTLQFGKNLLAETNSFKLTIDKKGDLEGLPKGVIDAAYDSKSGKWIFSLQNPSVMAFLQYSSKRNLREKIWNAYQLRGNNNNSADNKAIIQKIIVLRLKKANLLGYPTFAAFSLERNMAKNPDNVYKLLNQLWTPALNRAKAELGDMQAMVDAEKGKFKIAPWDWRYYAEKVRKEKYDLDEEQLRPYFKLENVRDGLFYVANKLYGLKFDEIKDIPKYHPDVVAYEVKNTDGSHLAILYMDFFPRDSKRGGAWMTSYRDQYKFDGKNITPVVSLVCNFTKPTTDAPSLLSLEEVQTLFHEFGHGLHGMLSQCTYKSLSGTSVARDFVELPSQIMENWATDPDVLKVYARHYKTGEEIPDELIKKLNNSQYFNQGFATVEYLAASFLDMDYYTLKDTTPIDVLSFEKQSLSKIQLIPEIISRYRSTYFNHIFAGGYSAGYYSYIWAEILDADAFDYFKTNGIFDPKTAASFRQNILEKGGTEDPMVLYKRFRGVDPQITPLLKRRGLL
jgi:peptidyl-dipeptidase Dcp